MKCQTCENILFELILSYININVNNFSAEHPYLSINDTNRTLRNNPGSAEIVIHMITWEKGWY